MKKESTEEKDILPILKIIFIVLLVLCALLLSVFLLLWTAKRTQHTGANMLAAQEGENNSQGEPVAPDNIEATEMPTAEPEDTPEPENTEVPVATQEPEDDGIKTVFTECNEKVCPKIEVNLRTLPSVTNPESQVVVTIRHGDIVTRTGINTDVGWSRVEYGGQVLYCVSSYVYVVEE